MIPELDQLKLNLYLEFLYDATIKTEKVIAWCTDETIDKVEKIHKQLQKLYFNEVAKYEDIR